MKYTLELSNISFHYNTTKSIIKQFSCRLPSGSVCALLGTNGVGKSTLLKIIARLIQPHAGEIVQNESFFYIPQSANTGLPVSVIESVLIGRASKVGIFDIPNHQDYIIAEQALKEVGILDFKDKDYSLLSGGEQQLVLLARALASGAETLIFDEPFSAMDLHNQANMLGLFKDLSCKNHSIIFSTHSVQHALTFSDYSILMFKGGKTIFGVSNEILTDENLTQLYQIPMYCLSLNDVIGGSVVITDFNYQRKQNV